MLFSTAVYTAACIDVNKKLYARQAAAFRSPIEFKVNNFAKALNILAENSCDKFSRRLFLDYYSEEKIYNFNLHIRLFQNNFKIIENK